MKGRNFLTSVPLVGLSIGMSSAAVGGNSISISLALQITRPTPKEPLRENDALFLCIETDHSDGSTPRNAKKRNRSKRCGVLRCVARP